MTIDTLTEKLMYEVKAEAAAFGLEPDATSAVLRAAVFAFLDWLDLFDALVLLHVEHQLADLKLSYIHLKETRQRLRALQALARDGGKPPEAAEKEVDMSHG